MAYRLGEKLSIKGEMPYVRHSCVYAGLVLCMRNGKVLLGGGVIAVTEKSCIFVGE